MTPLILGLVLLSALLHPIWNLLIKRASSPSGAFLVLAATLVGLGAVQALVTGTSLIPPREALPVLALSALGQSVYGVALVAVLRRGDLSAYYPVVRASPVGIVAFGWLVEGKSYGPALLAGIALVLVGGYRLQTAPGRRLDDPIALGAALLSMCGVATYSIADGLATQLVPPELLMVWVQSTSMPLLFLGFRAVGMRVPFALPKRVPWVALVAGALAYASYYLILLAYQWGGAVAAVASVRQASIPLSVLIGALWLGEKRLAGRLPASLLVAAGIILIVFNR